MFCVTEQAGLCLAQRVIWNYQKEIVRSSHASCSYLDTCCLVELLQWLKGTATALKAKYTKCVCQGLFFCLVKPTHPHKSYIPPPLHCMKSNWKKGCLFRRWTFILKGALPSMDSKRQNSVSHTSTVICAKPLLTWESEHETLNWWCHQVAAAFLWGDC